MVRAAKHTSRDIRVANRFHVLRHILAAPAVSRQEIAAETALSFATVSNLIGELLALGLLVEVGFQDSGGGRPRGLVAVNPGGGFLIGIDTAETYVHVDLFDAALTVLATVEERLSGGERCPEQIVERLVSGVGTVMAQAGVAPDGVLGVGVSVPGQVDHEGGVSVFAPNWDWLDVPLRGMLRSRLPMPVHLDNPLRASAVAELWFGAGRGHDDLAVLTLGTGVGAGLALGGSLYRGVTNSAGEWGHTTLVLGGRPCRCGNRGCVETYVGAPGIMQHLREVAPDNPMLCPGDQTATIEALAAGLAAGDPVAVAVADVTAGYLAAAIADLVNLLNPEVVVLGSWVAAKLGQGLLARVRDRVAGHALRRPLDATQIVLGQASGDAVSLGAATFALERFLASIGAPLGGVVRPVRR
ncbi:MAG: ROK family transcriptional regulator [Dactylosporangium sp.]|nr:ROK family transcriptional regulator [Dactylosporangium sp.]NNJ63045.1 ROK family transcriptional regulator [Dactylosporangium sp.]